MFQSKTYFNVSDCWLKLNGYQPFLNGLWKYPYWLEKATFGFFKPLTKIHLWTTISRDAFKRQTNADVASAVQSIQAERSSSWMNWEAIFEPYTEAVGVLLSAWIWRLLTEPAEEQAEVYAINSPGTEENGKAQIAPPYFTSASFQSLYFSLSVYALWTAILQVSLAICACCHTFLLCCMVLLLFSSPGWESSSDSHVCWYHDLEVTSVACETLGSQDLSHTER